MSESSKHQDEEIVIVKKIEGPSVDDEYNFEEVNVNTSKPKRSKRSFFIILLIFIISILAYVGFDFLKDEKKTTLSQTTASKHTELNTTKVEPVVIKKEVEKAKEVIKPKKVVKKKEEEKVAPKRYIEALAMPTKVEEQSAVKEKEKTLPTKKVIAQTIALKKPLIKQIPIKEVQPQKIKPKKVQPKKAKPKKSSTAKVYYEKVKPRIIHVKKGDSLAILAKRFYGNSMKFKSIVRANSRIKSSKTSLRLGEKLVIPRTNTRKTRRYILVKKGDTLAKLAKQFYGDSHKISKIISSNYKIKSKKSPLHVGQKVYIPR